MTAATFDPSACCAAIGKELVTLSGGAHNAVEIGGDPINVLGDLATLVEALCDSDMNAFGEYPRLRETLQRLAYRATLEVEKVEMARRRITTLARAGHGRFPLLPVEIEEVARLLSEAADE
jgi:hypothetical protein